MKKLNPAIVGLLSLMLVSKGASIKIFHFNGATLSLKEKKEIIAFLKTLNDSSFIINPMFNNPFLRKK